METVQDDYSYRMSRAVGIYLHIFSFVVQWEEEEIFAIQYNSTNFY